MKNEEKNNVSSSPKNSETQKTERPEPPKLEVIKEIFSSREES